jgi:hypothetical protein
MRIGSWAKKMKEEVESIELVFMWYIVQETNIM